MKVKITDNARTSLNDIYEYFKNLNKGIQGRKIRSRIIQKALKLKTYPYLGQKEILLEQLKLGHRYLVEGTYKIIYRVDEENNIIYITDIFDTRQSTDKMKP